MASTLNTRLPVLALAPLLLRGRAASGRAAVDVLAAATFTASTGLLLSVVAGARAFLRREAQPPQAFLAALGERAADGVTQLPMWTFLATGAAVLLVVPLLTLSAAAARMGALGRDQRLAALRLIGLSSAGTVALTATETMATAALGAAAGFVLYLLLLPVWQVVTFQATPLTMAEMLLPWEWVVAVLAAGVALAGIAAVLGLREVQVSPLGVARLARRRGLRLSRLLAVGAAVVAWVVVAPTLDFNGARTAAIAVTFVMLTCFMGVTNLVGPLVLQLAGQVMVRQDSADSLLAGRRLLADPRGAWRNVAGLAFVGFTGGALLSLPDFTGLDDPLTAMLAADLRTGTLLTIAIAFVVAAASTSLNQAVAVLDRRRTLVHLDHAGAPAGLVHTARRREVVVPTLLASVGSAALSGVFFVVLGLTATLGPNLAGLAALALVLAIGLVTVVAAAEGCRPLVRGILAGAGARAD